MWCDSVWGDESHPGWLDKWQDYGNNDIHSRAFLLLDSSAPCRWYWDKLAWLHAKLLMFPCSHEEKKCTNWTVSKSCKLVEFSWVSLGPFDRWCLWAPSPVLHLQSWEGALSNFMVCNAQRNQDFRQNLWQGLNRGSYGAASLEHQAFRTLEVFKLSKSLWKEQWSSFSCWPFCPPTTSKLTAVLQYCPKMLSAARLLAWKLSLDLRKNSSILWMSTLPNARGTTGRFVWRRAKKKVRNSNSSKTHRFAPWQRPMPWGKGGSGNGKFADREARTASCAVPPMPWTGTLWGRSRPLLRSLVQSSMSIAANLECKLSSLFHF